MADSKTFPSLLPIASSTITKDDKSDWDDRLCTFCGEWATTRSCCAKRFEALQCYDPKHAGTDDDIEVVFCCDCCRNERELSSGPRKEYIRFPCGTVLFVDCMFRMND